ncbi:XRE family transcriptional regulator [Streptomyces dangxiongensis]|uniref:XRE family transcriptional regulator n=1 Tax=Streptomyces dangxiongensis TaxID=1442032 RepID=A0A3G2JL84_9ACTN|nr:helix-turn-helix transcriptional regulator [Streptomyces dangxiongensis]AYN43143.1 XRE family transcriptional regulator [Streptomyces dangxiongensis]
MSAPPDDVQEFAARLTRLKERTDRSYGQLARRLNMNTSTLHRYCAGDTVPVDFAPVERLAALCGASPQERLELHRLWLLAVASRQRARTAGAGAGAASGGGVPVAAVASGGGIGSGAVAGAGSSAAEEPAPAAAPPRRPWYRRRRVIVAAAAASMLVATLGSLVHLPSDRPTARGTAHRPTPSRTRTTAAAAHGPATASASPMPSAILTEKPSATPTKTPARSSQGSPSKPPAAGVPLTWTADSQIWEIGCSHDYVIAKPPQEVPPPPAPQDAGAWAATQNAVHGRNTLVEISVQGKTSTAVVLEALRVRVVGRTAAPPEGNVYAMDQGCGADMSPRYFGVDLDKDRPIARPVPGSDMGAPIPAMRLPYRVSATDPEVLLVTAETATCDCRWYLELEWSSQGRTGTVRIDDHGRPFRTTGIKGLPHYSYATWKHEWAPRAH